MSRTVARFLFPLLAFLLSSCSPLGAFNALVPKDGGSRLVAKDRSYGAHPRQRLDVYAPRRPSAEPLPIIVFFYGGSWSSGDKGGYAFAGHALAARGFLVAIPDYRLVPEVRFPAFLEDSAAAVRWVRSNAARFGGDPDRIVLVGHSAGAYNAAMLSLDPQWLGIDRATVRGFAGIAGPYDFLPLDTAVSQAAFGEAPDLPATQPVNFASSGDPPTLLVTGHDDTTVYPRNSLRLAERLAGAGVPVETRLYDDVGHVGALTALARPFRGKAPVLRDVTQFAVRVTSLSRPAS